MKKIILLSGLLAWSMLIYWCQSQQATNENLQIIDETNLSQTWMNNSPNWWRDGQPLMNWTGGNNRPMMWSWSNFWTWDRPLRWFRWGMWWSWFNNLPQEAKDMMQQMRDARELWDTQKADEIRTQLQSKYPNMFNHQWPSGRAPRDWQNSTWNNQSSANIEWNW